MLGHEEQFFNAKKQLAEDIEMAITNVIDGREGAEDELLKLKKQFTWNEDITAEYSYYHNMDGKITIDSIEEAKENIDDYPDFDDVEWSDGIEDGDITYQGLVVDVDDIELVNPSKEAVAKQNEAKLKSQQDELLREISRKIKAAKRDGISEEQLNAVLESA